MKRKLLELLAFLLFIGPIIYIYGQAGAIDHYKITMEQGAVQMGKAILVLAVDMLLINYLGKEEDYAE